MPEALAALESDAQVHVETDPCLMFRPTNQDPTTGLILYPGGRVDPRAYAPAARALAEEGHLVIIAPAIGNALFALTGVRLRWLPMTPGRVKAALES